MGVFFERQADPAITQLLRTALTAAPPVDAEQGRTMSVQMAGQLQPVVNAVSKALAATPPSPAAADAQHPDPPHAPVRGTALPAPIAHHDGIPAGRPLVAYGEAPAGSQ